MQCKEIPSLPILRFLDRLSPRWATWGGGWEHSVDNAMPAGTPSKVVRAKMARLMKRGLVKGCNCGCRGDYEITEKGKALLSE